MSPAELYELYYMAQDAMDRLLQFMITISFAVVIAAYLGSDKLNGFLYSVVGVLFTLVFVILGFRMNTAIEKAIEFQARLAAHGEVFEDYSWLPPVSGVTGILLYFCTIGFLLFWYIQGKKRKKP